MKKNKVGELDAGRVCPGRVLKGGDLSRVPVQKGFNFPGQQFHWKLLPNVTAVRGKITGRTYITRVTITYAFRWGRTGIRKKGK